MTFQARIFFHHSILLITSNGGYRPKEKSRKHCQLSTKFMSLVIAIFFYLLEWIKSNCMYWLHWKLQKNRTSYTHWHAFLYFHAKTYVKTFIYSLHLKEKRKDWAKWTEWAGLHKNTLTDKQLCSLTCFLVSIYSNKHRYTPLLIPLKIIKKNLWKIITRKNIRLRAFCLAPNKSENKNKLSNSLILAWPSFMTFA